jgi:hypothetical protein
MKKIIFAIAFTCAALSVVAQDIKMLDGRWAFSGNRTTVFTVKNDTLFVSLVDNGDLKNFETFYSGKPLTDPGVLSRAQTSVVNGKMLISCGIKRGDKSTLMVFIYDQKDSLHIQYIGDVYYGEKKAPYINDKCNTDVPYCTNRLYYRNDAVKISKLKSLAGITKAEVIDLFTKLSNANQKRCNKCYEGLEGADVNVLLIEMGYNPINKVPKNATYQYSVSGFDFFMDKHGKDPEVMEAYKNYRQQFFMEGTPAVKDGQSETKEK